MMFPVICLALNVVLQVAIMRLVPNAGLLKSIFLGFIFGMICLIFLSMIKGSIYFFAADLITYVALGYCYFHFLNLGETARRIRILRELYDFPEGLSMGDILSRYNAKIIIDARIKRLIDSGQITLKDGRYHIGFPVMLLMAGIMLFMKSLILGRRRGP